MFCRSLSHCNHKLLACHYKSLGFSLLLQSFLNLPKLFAASGPKIHCLVTKPLGFRFPEQFFIFQKWRRLQCSDKAEPLPVLLWGKAVTVTWFGSIFLSKTRSSLEDRYYCSYAQAPAYDQVNTVVQRAVVNKISCHNQLGQAPRQWQA